MPIGMSLLSVFLAFFFSFLAVQCTGVTDITPLTAASKASQIILGGATKGEHWQTDHAQRLNLLGGALANMGANQATDLTQDFRTGFLLRTPPIQQWLVQGLGTFVAIFLAPAIFNLFMTAYPCVILMEDKCAFSAPSVAAWRIVAIAATDPTLPIPTSAGIFAIIFAAFGCFMCVLRHYVWVGKLEWVRTYHPNMMCVALAFVLPQTYCKLYQIPPFTRSNANGTNRRYCYGHRLAHSLPMGEEERKALRGLLLRRRCWSDRWRGDRRCAQRYSPDRRRFGRLLWLWNCLPWRCMLDSR